MSDRSALRAVTASSPPPAADWGSADQRRRIAAGRGQLLARAAGLARTPDCAVLDATAGLGRDGFTLAALGARVTLAERNPDVFALLEDAHRRALANPALAEAAQRVTLSLGDGRSLMPRGWDVIYLDPMYPGRGKTALAKKELEFLRGVTGGDADAGALLAPALAGAVRVVVKRPLRALPLAGVVPNHALSGTQARFDVYLGARR